MQDATGLSITHHNRTVRLKWHQLRKRMTDPVFSPEVMAEGFVLGASMELDLCVRADGGFVVLHDNTLEGETTGSGPVAAYDRATLAPLRYLASGRSLLISENLAGMIATAHPDTLLQFDLKDTLDRVGDAGLLHLKALFEANSRHLILGSLDLGLIARAREVAPELTRGIDPSKDMVAAAKDGGIPAAFDVLKAALSGPTDASTVYLHWRLILRADDAGFDLIGACHDRGKIVDAWTFNLSAPATGFDDAEWAAFLRLVELGADQITTDEAPATERAWRQRIGV